MSDIPVLDLHGLYRGEAVQMLEDFLFDSRQKGFTQVEIITGRGSHSLNGVPVLKNAVLSYLNIHSFSYTESNSFLFGGGSLYVYL